MREPTVTPWKEGGADEAHLRAAKLVAQVAELPPKPVSAAPFDGALAVATRRSSRLVPALVAAAAAAMVAVVGVVAWQRAHPLGITEVLVASNGARWSTPAPGSLRLDSGRLELTHALRHPVKLQTPQVTIEAREARFAAEVTGQGTSVTLFEGALVVKSGDASVSLAPGETRSWAATPAISPSLVPPAEAASAVESCSGANESGREACLEREASGSGLSAEAALYELGLYRARAGRVDQAVAAWDESLRRFPDGVLAPEAHLSMLVQLTQGRRFARATSVAKDFEARFPDDPRRAEVAALRAQLEPMR